jgi:hypothetical protein
MTFKVHAEDQQYVDIIAPHMNHGPWIAGGAVMRWVQGRPVGASDIDVFVKDGSQFQHVYRKLEAAGFNTVFTSDNAVTLVKHDYNHKTKEGNAKKTIVQIIRKRFYRSARSVINDFDLTISQFITDGNNLLCGEFAMRDLAEKVIYSANPNKAIISRMIKYMCYGFTPSEALLEYISNEPDLILSFAGSNEYDTF